MSEMSEEVVQSADLVTIPKNGVARALEQRTSLKEFVSRCLSENIDHGIIPGTKKPSLFKPGAEKLASLFGLGSRIVHSEQAIDQEKQFAMFTYTVEIFHLASGKAISQCQGSANSSEKKYCKIELPDLFNTLQKMAQKRAYVGAVISATGASDFFTQDTEDTHLAPRDAPPQPPKQEPKPSYEAYICDFGTHRGKRLHQIADLDKYIAWMEGEMKATKEPIALNVQKFVREAKAFLAFLEQAKK